MSEPEDEDFVIKCGAPIRKLAFSSIKQITICVSLLLSIDIFYSFRLFVSAVSIRMNFGSLINMISSGDGDILPTLQAIPVLIFLLLNLLMCWILYKIFDPEPRPNLNRIMYVCCLLSSAFIIVVFIVICAVIGHSYSEHAGLHDGIVTAMNNYSNNLEYKMQIDKLQIEFQCCGSKKYDEWYAIKWFDPSLDQESKSADGHTPFSCCSMKSLFPCIHHNIEKTGTAYMYTPEENLSISTRGCYEMIRERKQEIGWGVVWNLTIFLLLQTLTLSNFRFIQTAHFGASRFFGNDKIYTVWLFGCYTGRVKKDVVKNQKPPVPPVPEELKH